jgi:GxxExxY protein|tara:strand:- start:153 stop:620 length:468 start_codon:yes stop_codon:yes gene_type:complete
VQKFLQNLEKISLKVFTQLSGMEEKHFQTALGIELRKNKIDFMREAGLELFYDNHPIGLHELDFLVTPCLDLKEPIIIETKIGVSIDENSRQQLRNYLRSALKNDNSLIKKIKMGIVLNFKKTEIFIDNQKKKKASKDVQIEVWKYESKKFSQLY